MRTIFRTFSRKSAKISEKNLAKNNADLKQAESDVTKTWMASRHVFIPSLPLPLHQSAKALFSAHPLPTLRNWGYQLAESYIKIYGLEKPTDIRKIQPFATTLKTIEENSKSAQNKGFYKLPSESLPSLQDTTKLQQMQEKEKKLPYQREHAIGYAYKKMPNTYSSIYRILHEIKHRMPNFDPKKCLDFGSGTGSAGWATCELFPNTQVTCIEPDKEMRTVGKKLAVNQPNIKWAESLANLSSLATEEGKFDLVICAYVLSEVENPVTRNLILDALWHRCAKVLVFVEPGTPKGFRLVYNVREWTLKTMTRSEANIIAPCPHDGECPLAADPKSWCHFSQFSPKYPKNVVTRVKGETEFENEKFSYVAVLRGESPRYFEDNLNLAQQSFLWGRFVRPTIRRKKHIIFDICRLDKLERIVISKGKAVKEVYKFLKKAKWGDLWPFSESEYFDEERRKIKLKKYRVKRKLKKSERRLAEKGESEGTDLEEEKKKIQKKQEGDFKEAQDLNRETFIRAKNKMAGKKRRIVEETREHGKEKTGEKKVIGGGIKGKIIGEARDDGKEKTEEKKENSGGRKFKRGFNKNKDNKDT